MQTANGHGQEVLAEASHVGRRLRYVDAVRCGKELQSTFVAVHEPSGPGGSMPVRKVDRVSLPDRVGPDAVVLRIESKWGTYYVFSECRREVQVDDVCFQGRFGVFCKTTEGGNWLLTSGAKTMQVYGFGFEDAPAVWKGKVVDQTETGLRAETSRPAGWADVPDQVTNYVRVKTQKYMTGFPVRSAGRNRIVVERFPLQKATRFELSEVRFWGNDVPPNPAPPEPTKD